MLQICLGSYMVVAVFVFLIFLGIFIDANTVAKR